MTITNGYIDLAGFKTRFFTGTPSTDTSRDAEIEKVIQGVSRQIDAYCHREFFLSAADEARYYTAAEYRKCFTDDINTVTTLKTDEDGDGVYETTWDSSDYKLMPLNGTPKTWIELAYSGNYSFPTVLGGVEIVGKFGYCALASVPDQVREACYIQAFRIWMRQKAPFGVTGSAEMGQLIVIPKLDPDVELMLAPFVRKF